MSLDPVTRDRMVKAIPGLHAFACSLCRNRDRADDLVQETLLRAIDRIDTFSKGTNLEAWLFTIMRNNFNTQYRNSKRIVQDQEGRCRDALGSTGAGRLGHRPRPARRVRNAPARSAAGPVSRRRHGLELRRGRRDGRLRGRHRQEPCPPCTFDAGGLHVRRDDAEKDGF